MDLMQQQEERCTAEQFFRQQDESCKAMEHLFKQQEEAHKVAKYIFRQQEEACKAAEHLFKQQKEAFKAWEHIFNEWKWIQLNIIELSRALGSETNPLIKRDMEADIVILINRKISWLTGYSILFTQQSLDPFST